MFSLSDVALETINTCPICHSIYIDLLFTAHDTLHNMPGEWGIQRCKECHFMFTSPRPTRCSIGCYYPDDYSPFISFNPRQKKSTWKDVGKTLFQLLLDPKEEILPEIDSGSLLEVGCATGRSLEKLRQRGWKVHGLEPAKCAVEQLQELGFEDVKAGTIECAEYSNNHFDLILAFMVLEHVHDPISDLKKLHNWLKPGGTLSGSVPNCGSWEFKVFGPHWFALQVPTHLSHFAAETLKKALLEAGFVKITIYHQRNLYNLTVQFGRLLKQHHLPLSEFFCTFPEKAPWWARIIARLVATPLAWARQSGRISFTAEKPRD